MFFRDWLTQDFVNSIPYLAENEADNLTIIYNWLLSKYGYKTTSPFADSVTNNEISGEVLANIISLFYADKWENLKDIITSTISPTGINKTITEQVDNSIYGYNGDAANDYTNKRSRTEFTEYDNIFDELRKNIDFRGMFSYYNVVVNDIARALTTAVYE